MEEKARHDSVYYVGVIGAEMFSQRTERRGKLNGVSVNLI